MEVTNMKSINEMIREAKRGPGRAESYSGMPIRSGVSGVGLHIAPARPGITSVDYVLCAPGDPSSMVQSLAREKAFLVLAMAGKRVGLMHSKAANVFRVRDQCLRGERLVNGVWKQGHWKDQKPYENVYLDYDRTIWIDSDNVVDAETIQKLIDHDVDIAAAWCRVWSHGEISPKNGTGCGFMPDNHSLTPITVGEMENYPTNDDGLIEVDWTGFCLTVIKKRVFEALEYPWFTSWNVEWTDEDGEECSQSMSEDIGFCIRAKQAGFKIFVDPTAHVLHEKLVGL